MAPNARRSDGPSRRAIGAIAAPVALVAVAGALTLATPANAAGTASLPFPTLCSTSTPTTANGGASASASASATTSRSATATPQASASPSPSATKQTPGKTGAGQSAGTPDPPSSPAKASASKSTAAGGNAAAASPTPATPTPSPSASSSSSSGGFWGWLNGVWTWIFGAVQLPHAAAAPAMNAAFVRTMAGTHSQAQAAPRTPTTPTPTATASCVPRSAIKANAATSGGDVAAVVPWHLTTPSMTMYSLTYNGVTTIKTSTGSQQVLDFTASKVTLLSMVTYSTQCCGKLQYVDGGQGQTVTLLNAHLMTTSITSDVLGLLHQTFTPANPGLLTLLQGITIPIPVLFTNVDADNAFLNTQTIIIPGFNGHGN